MRIALRFVAIMIACGIATGPLQAQVPVERSSAISGIIVTPGTEQSPIANVWIELTDRLTGDAVITRTTRDGRFLFTRLPAGAYVVSASKPSYVTTRYGASVASRLGTALVVARGEHVRDVTMVLQRGAVITGVVYDANGAPSSRKAVSILQRKPGRDGIVWTGISVDSAVTNDGSPMTDEHGRYRIYGLAPGDYRVAIGLGRPLPFSLHRTTAADLDRARRLIAAPPAPVSAANGLPDVTVLPLRDMFVTTTAPQGEVVSYAPVYFPGTPSVASATTITLGFGEERDGIDVHLEWTRTATIEGMVVGKDEPLGSPPMSMIVQVIRKDSGSSQRWGTGTPQTDDRFSLAGFPPGEYVVEAMFAAFRSAGSSSPSAMFASADVVIHGADVSNVVLPLRPAVSMAGRVMVDGAAAAGPVRITMTPDGVSSASLVAVRTADSTDGRVSLLNLAPARYRVGADATILNGRLVTLDQISIGGVDVTHSVIDLAVATTRGDLEVRFSTKATELKGSVQDASGALSPGYVILAFSVDRNAWYWHSKAIQFQKLSTVADFDFHTLPAGNYFLAALSDLEPNQEFDPTFLEEVSASAVRVALVGGSPVVQNLRVGKRQ